MRIAISKILKEKRRGFILPLAMVAASVLFVIGVGLLCLGFQRRLASIRANRQLIARAAADYGLTKALYETNNMLRSGTWDDSALPCEQGVAVAGADAQYAYAVLGDMWTGYSIQAVGTKGSTHRTIQCDLRIKGPFEHAILTRGTMDLINGSLVDWFNNGDDDSRLKIGTTSASDDSIILKSGVVVNGDIMVGEGGRPIDVIDDQGATINGIVYPSVSDNDIIIPEVPDDLASAASQGAINSSVTISTSGRYDSIRMLNGETLTIDGGVTLYVTGDVTLDNSARIDISEANDACLTIYLAGSMDGKNSSGFNNLTQEPPKLKVFGLPTCSSIIIKNSAVFYGVIYAPNATVDMHNSAEIYGAVVAENYIQRNSAAFYYDASLGDAGIGDEFIRFVPTHWREL